MNFRKVIVETLAYLTLIAGLLIVWAICANAQTPTLCGRESTVGSVRVELTYRKAGETTTVTSFSAVNDKYDSGVAWVLGDVEIITVRVIELRDVSAAVIQ